MRSMQPNGSRNRGVCPIVLGSLALWAAMVASYTARSEEPAMPADLSGMLAEISGKHALPGIVAATLENGKIIAIGAAGVRKQGTDIPITVDDKLHIGSCTKAMTAVLMATLVQDKLLDWNTTLADAFPDLSDMMHADYTSVTITQLLGHRAGLPANPSWWQGTQGSDVVAQRAELVKRLLSKPPQRKPGTTFMYSNLGYVVAGAIAEKITGKAWEALMQERVFVPLQIISAGFGPPSVDRATDQPWGHGRQVFQVTPLQLDNPPLLGPAGRVHLTIRDWARFVSVLLPANPDEPYLLTSDSLQRLLTPLPAVEGDRERDYALGWHVTQRPSESGRSLTHAGSNTMWYALVRAIPARRLAVLVVCNSGVPAAAEACEEAAVEMLKRQESVAE